MYIILLYFGISKAAKTGTVQVIVWKISQTVKLEAFVMLCGILWEYFFLHGRNTKFKKNLNKHKNMMCFMGATQDSYIQKVCKYI